MKKYQDLKKYFSKLDSFIIAYSGGVDSALLLKAASEMVNKNFLAVTFASEVFPVQEIDDAKALADSLGVKHKIIDVDHLRLLDNNPENRCYICKKYFFGILADYAKAKGFKHIIDGSNFDDTRAYRPGRVAAKELGVISPLEILKYTKQEIRDISLKLELPTHNKKSNSCYLTRFPHDLKVTSKMIEDIHIIETEISNLWINFLRARHKGDNIVIVVRASEMNSVVSKRKEIANICQKQGYENAYLDLKAYDE